MVVFLLLLSSSLSVLLMNRQNFLPRSVTDPPQFRQDPRVGEIEFVPQRRVGFLADARGIKIVSVESLLHQKIIIIIDYTC